MTCGESNRDRSTGHGSLSASCSLTTSSLCRTGSSSYLVAARAVKRRGPLLAPPYGQLGALGRVAEHAQQVGQRGRPFVDVVQLGVEEGDRRVGEVVVRRDPAERARGERDAVLANLDAAGAGQVRGGRLDEEGEVAVGPLWRRVGAMVVGGVLQQPAVKVGPREEVDRVLFTARGVKRRRSSAWVDTRERAPAWSGWCPRPPRR